MTLRKRKYKRWAQCPQTSKVRCPSYRQRTLFLNIREYYSFLNPVSNMDKERTKRRILEKTERLSGWKKFRAAIVVVQTRMHLLDVMAAARTDRGNEYKKASETGAMAKRASLTRKKAGRYRFVLPTALSIARRAMTFAHSRRTSYGISP